MKAIKILSIALVLGMTACEEFQPVFTGKYEEPGFVRPVDMKSKVNTTIAELKDIYTVNKAPVTIQDYIVIGGQVTTSDQVGNLYKSLYIQDETAGIELKLGKNGLYNEYKVGQWLYVVCEGLTVGDYNGMIQLGYSDPTGEYGTSYMEHQYIIDNHVFKGAPADPVQPVVITEAELKDKKNLGRLVTIKDLTYGWVNNYGEAQAGFALLYLDSNKDKKQSSNRIFISGDKGGSTITTWAMSKEKMTQMLLSGVWDSISIGNAGDYNYGTVGDRKGDGTYPAIEKAAYSVSQYFKMGNTSVQVRSSGYCRFSDNEIDPELLAGNKKVDFTGILTEYQGSAQFTLIDLDGVKIHD